MKKKDFIILTLETFRTLTILVLLILLFSSCSNTTSNKAKVTQNINNTPKEVIWHVKAIDYDGVFLDVKAFDKKGNSFYYLLHFANRPK